MSALFLPALCAAVLTAVNLASAILKTGEGLDSGRPVCVNVDGSTYYRTLTADFPQRVQRELAALMYDAHETLTRLDPQNLQRFKDVLAFLREDLKRF